MVEVFKRTTPSVSSNQMTVTSQHCASFWRYVRFVGKNRVTFFGPKGPSNLPIQGTNIYICRAQTDRQTDRQIDRLTGGWAQMACLFSQWSRDIKRTLKPKVSPSFRLSCRCWPKQVVCFPRLSTHRDPRPDLSLECVTGSSASMQSWPGKTYIKYTGLMVRSH